jgi:hypothetical protein
MEEIGMLQAPPLANLIPAWDPLWLRRAERQINPPIDGYQGEIALHCITPSPLLRDRVFL